MHSRLIDALGPDEQVALIARLRPRTYKRGQTVFNEADPGDCIHLVQSGRLSVEMSTAQGQVIIVRVVQPGEHVGELALVHPDSRRSARVCALEPTETLALYRRDLDALRESQPGVDRFLVVALADLVRRTTDFAVELLLPPEQRVWRRLEVLAEAYGDAPIRMSQDDLARAAGTVRQTVNRVLRAGVQVGALGVDRGTIRVLDSVTVRQMARR